MTADLFPDTEARRSLPSPIVRKAEISECGQFRWTLTRTWRSGPHVCFCGLNPSTADALKDDPTVIRWTRFADAWGYGGFVAVNLYPYRTPNVPTLKQWVDIRVKSAMLPADRGALFDNRMRIVEEARRADLFVACWGAAAWDWGWIDVTIYELGDREFLAETGYPEVPIHCLGATASGAPIHPMARGRHRVPDDVQPQLWRKAE